MRRNPNTDATLEAKIAELSGKQRGALLDDLVARHAPEEAARMYGGRRSRRSEVLAVLRAFPRARISAISELVYGTGELEARLRVAGILKQLEGALVESIAHGCWQPIAAKARRAAKTRSP